MFLTSTRVPNASLPTGRSETLASTRIWPLSMAASRGADGHEQQAQLLGVAAGRLGVVDDRVADDLQERRAGAVEVEQADRPAAEARVDEARRVLLEVRPRDADLRPAAGGLHDEPARRGQRQLVLADLVALGQVRVEVVLAVPAGDSRDGGADGEARRQHVADGLPVDDRQRARQPQADRAGARVGRRLGRVVEQPQNILEAVRSWTWISMPMTAS